MLTKAYAARNRAAEAVRDCVVQHVRERRGESAAVVTFQLNLMTPEHRAWLESLSDEVLRHNKLELDRTNGKLERVKEYIQEVFSE